MDLPHQSPHVPVKRTWRTYPDPPSGKGGGNGNRNRHGPGNGNGQGKNQNGGASPAPPSPGQGQPPGRAYQLQSSGAPGPAPNGLPTPRSAAPPPTAQLPSPSPAQSIQAALNKAAQDLKNQGMTYQVSGSNLRQPPRPKNLESKIEHGHTGSESGQATNKVQVFTPEMEKKLRLRRLQAEFARIVGCLAEDLVGQPILGDDEWDVNALLDRRITKRSISSCRQSREREALVLILDNSGSCSEMATFYSELANVAAKSGDVEIYLGPNAYLERRFTRKDGWKEVCHNSTEALGWRTALKGRVILFFGDFDGTQMISDWSRENQLYWFNCHAPGSTDARVAEVLVHYQKNGLSKFRQDANRDMGVFKGKLWACSTEQDLFRLAKRIRPRQRS